MPSLSELLVAAQLPYNQGRQNRVDELNKQSTLAQIATQQNEARYKNSLAKLAEQKAPLELQKMQQDLDFAKQSQPLDIQSKQQTLQKNQNEMANEAIPYVAKAAMFASLAPPEEQADKFSKTLDLLKQAPMSEQARQSMDYFKQFGTNPENMQLLVGLMDPKNAVTIEKLLSKNYAGLSSKTGNEKLLTPVRYRDKDGNVVYVQPSNVPGGTGQVLDPGKGLTGFDPEDDATSASSSTFWDPEAKKPVTVGSYFDKNTKKWVANLVDLPNVEPIAVNKAQEENLRSQTEERNTKLKQGKNEKEFAKQDVLFNLQQGKSLIFDKDFDRAVGPYDASTLSRMFGRSFATKAESIRRKADIYITEKVFSDAEALKPISNLDMDVLFSSKPKVTDNGEVWRNWYNGSVIPWFQKEYKTKYGEDLPYSNQLGITDENKNYFSRTLGREVRGGDINETFKDLKQRDKYASYEDFIRDLKIEE